MEKWPTQPTSKSGYPIKYETWSKKKGSKELGYNVDIWKNAKPKDIKRNMAHFGEEIHSIYKIEGNKRTKIFSKKSNKK